MGKTFNSDEQGAFQNELRAELNSFLFLQKRIYPQHDVLKIDLHCHDYNSDVPDELLGRILNVPETWLKTERLTETLHQNEVDVITITNHNNARSCFELKKHGQDVLVGAEFSCMVPDFQIGIHVLAYGFDKEQERILNKLRRDVYKFQRYACEENIPTVWAHPLYHYKASGIPPMDFFNKMALIFERFEVLNGQRDTWQNLLVVQWLEGLTPDRINLFSETYRINPRIYCSNPYKKSYTGGSDSHMGIFAGQTGTYLYVPDLAERLKTKQPSELALEALRKGNMAVYGNHQNFEKLTIAFLDYVCQIAMNKKDPGLMRILLHKGTSKDKLLALFVSNVFAELQQHKVTMRFVELFHNCFMGIKPNISQRLLVPRTYKAVFDDALEIARINTLQGEDRIKMLKHHVNSIHTKLNKILYERIENKVAKIKNKKSFVPGDLNEFIERFEIPSDIRSLFGKNNQNEEGDKNPESHDVTEFLDGLSFPFLASFIILGANFTSAKVMYNNRELLKEFSSKTGRFQHPERMLWLTDTYSDKNGVSMFLQDAHREIKKRNLPVDILVCSSEIEPDDHLIVVKPMIEFELPYYENQTIRIPDFLQIHHLFLKNEYDRIVCSTEGVMGLLALYLKHAYSVPAYFYMHTDWIMFARKVLKADTHNLSRIRRILRAYYHAFDGVFVLNTEQKEWLTGQDMNFDPQKVFLTAHWVDKKFTPSADLRVSMFGVRNDDKVLLYAGRISKEKGVMELPGLYTRLKKHFPELKIVFAGTGPAEKELKDQIPDGIFLGWVDQEKLSHTYNSADLLVLPSRFDTFSCVVLEALSCGLPVIAYKTKGPKDIIQDQKSGYLVLNPSEMEYRIIEYFTDSEHRSSFKKMAIQRASGYKPNLILQQFMTDVKFVFQSQHEKIKAE